LLALISPYALSAGFDCQKATSTVERVICNNESLSGLDSEMSRVFKGIHENLDEAGRKSLKAEQLAWLRNTRNKCANENCVLNAYFSRLEALRTRPDLPELTTITSRGEELDVRLEYDSSHRIESFNESLSHTSRGKITACKMLVDIAVGTARGNHSYGGLCTLTTENKTEPVKICNDDMAGHFSLVKLGSNTTTIEELGTFVADNCYGG
jgi:uncharacterized protein